MSSEERILELLRLKRDGQERILEMLRTNEMDAKDTLATFSEVQAFLKSGKGVRDLLLKARVRLYRSRLKRNAAGRRGHTGKALPREQMMRLLRTKQTRD